MSLSRRQALAVGASAVAATSLTQSPTQAAAPDVKFQLGMVTYNVAANWDLAMILKICKSVGIAAVECRTTHKHGVEPSLSPQERQEIRKKFADSGIVFWGCGSVCEFHAADSAVVEKNIETFKKFAGLVADLGGKGVKVRPNGLVPGKTPEQSFEQIGKALVACGQAAESSGVEVWCEVHGKDTQNPENMKKIMEACGHRQVGITWNSNPTDVKGGSVKAAFEMLKPWLKSCHINEIYKDFTKGYPYRELFRLLRQAGYDRYTLIEVGRTPPDAASGEDMLRYYRALWQELVKE